MTTESRKQPPWLQPTPYEKGAQAPKLRVYNSLTKEKNDFVPVDRAGKKVTWYACGPTVYDDSHIGHARNYVTTDIMRRIMRDYFKYDVQFVMNITDVDDKIIVRARQQYFLDDFKAQHPTVDEKVRQTVQEAWTAYVTKTLAKLVSASPTDETFESTAWTTYELSESVDLAGLGAGAEQAAKSMMHIRAAVSASKALIAASTSQKPLKGEEFWPLVDDVLLPYLWTKGDSTPFEQDHSIFTALTRKFEQSFFDDMDNLNVLRPDRLTRVTEYVPQIVEYVEKIQDKNFAYAAKPKDPLRDDQHDVYFSIKDFEASKGNAYARLEPTSRGNEALQADGEGSLTKTIVKRSNNDFALWKSSKKGEPSWKSSRWGGGRPGWHIECSVMASDVLGPHIDIHSGGIDLAFPHHDNELAQSEAYYCQGHQHQWINYFVHMGHLHIQGAKMSKSLKNFKLIKDALRDGDFTSRSMRIVFLLSSWKDTIEVVPDSVSQAQSWESKVSYFFLKALDRQRVPTSSNVTTASTNGAGSDLQAKLKAAKQTVDEALMDSFDTPRAMHAISSLLTDYNTAETAGTLSDADIITAAQWITRMVTIFGLDAGANPTSEEHLGWSGIGIPEAAKQFVYPLSAMRDEIRRRARASDFEPSQLSHLLDDFSAADAEQAAASIQFAEAYSQTREDIQALISKSAPPKEFLALSDKLRDTTLWELGVYLEDQDLTGRPALISPLGSEQIRARQEKDAQAAAKAQQKELALREKAEQQRTKDEKAKISPREMFKTEENAKLYSEWNEDGLPMKDKEGQDVTKSALKKLQKMRQAQEKLHGDWLSRQGSS